MHGHENVERVLLTNAQLLDRVGELAADLCRDYAGRDVVLVPVLTGAMVFCSDLMRRMPRPMKLGLLTVSSYPGKSTTSQGVTLWEQQFDTLADRVAGRHVVLIEDILDTGTTLRTLVPKLEGLGAASVKTCVLLKKLDRPEAADVPADYVGFEIPDAFVVGYGLDYDDEYRNLPDVCVLRP